MIAGVEDPFVGTVKMDDVIRDIYADMLAAAPPVSDEMVEKVARLIEYYVDQVGYADKAARAILALINGENE